MTVGVVVFNFGAPVKPGKGGQSDSTYGLALIAFSLALDGATGGIQVLSPIRSSSPLSTGTEALWAEHSAWRQAPPPPPTPIANPR